MINKYYINYNFILIDKNNVKNSNLILFIYEFINVINRNKNINIYK